MKEIQFYQTDSGQMPCLEWLLGLDINARQRIDAYIMRAAQGAAKKNIRALGQGVYEIKINHGPGYRVYFGEVGRMIILLLIGGDKSTQFKDIRQAQDYWRSYVSK